MTTAVSASRQRQGRYAAVKRKIGVRCADATWRNAGFCGFRGAPHGLLTRRYNCNLVTCFAKPGAQVHVLIVEEIAFVKAAHRAQGFGAKKHEHSCHPVRVVDCVAVRRGRMRSRAERLGSERKNTGKVARVILRCEIGRGDRGRDNTDFRVRQKSRQRREGVRGEADVGIQDAEQAGARARQGGIVVFAKPLWFRVADDLQFNGRLALNSFLLSREYSPSAICERA